MAISLTSEVTEKPDIADTDNPELHVPEDVPESEPEPAPTNPDMDKISWILPTSDSEGHSDLYQFRGVPQLRRSMSDIIHSRRFPYHNESEIMRHAVHSHMAWLQTHPGCPRSQGSILQSMMLIVEQEEYDQQFSQSMARTGRMVNNALSRGNMAAAEQLITHLWDTLKSMEDSPWKEQYIQEFKAKFQTLITSEIVGRSQKRLKS